MTVVLFETKAKIIKINCKSCKNIFHEIVMYSQIAIAQKNQSHHKLISKTKAKAKSKLKQKII